MALVWKEISSQANLQINVSSSKKSVEVLRIRRIWQLANNKAVFDDEVELGVEQLSNDFASVEYVNQVNQNSNEWFVGDVVPFERCAYIVNFDSVSATNKFYTTFTRLQTWVRWDPIKKKKLVLT